MPDTVTLADLLAADRPRGGPRDWPEGAIYRYDRGGHEILRVVREVDPHRAALMAGAPVDLALVIQGPLLVVCSRVDEVLPWAAASFQWHRVGRSDRIIPTLGDDRIGSRLDLMLLASRGGRVRAVRSLNLPVDFTQALHQAIREQARSFYDPAEEARALKDLLQRYPTPDSLVGDASAQARLLC